MVKKFRAIENKIRSLRNDRATSTVAASCLSCDIGPNWLIAIQEIFTSEGLDSFLVIAALGATEDGRRHAIQVGTDGKLVVTNQYCLPVETFLDAVAEILD